MKQVEKLNTTIQTELISSMERPLEELVDLVLVGCNAVHSDFIATFYCYIEENPYYKRIISNKYFL
jgi:hypothetical protein